MSNILIILLVLLFIMCFCLYNWWFQREKYKKLMEHEKKNRSALNSPLAWGIYSAISFLAILAIIAYQMYILFSKIMEYNM